MGFFADYIFKRYGIPDVIMLLSMGILINFLGYSGNIPYDFINIFSPLALMFILFQTGTELRFYSLVKEIPKATLISILIFTLSAISVGLFVTYVFQIEFLTAILLGVIVGGSSSAIVGPIVMNLNLSKDIKSLLTVESTLTDALCVVISFTLLETILGGGAVYIEQITKVIVTSFSTAILIGLAFGLAWINILPKIEKYEFHYLLTIGMVFIVYSITEIFQGVGAISSFTFGLVLGNAMLFGNIFQIKETKPMTQITNTFHKLIGFIIRIFFFILLGVIVSITDLSLFAYGILITVFLLAIRYFSVEALFKSEETNNKRILQVMMPRGLAAAVLASIPIQYQITEALFFPEVVFSVILTSSLIATLGLIKFRPKNEIELPKQELKNLKSK